MDRNLLKFFINDNLISRYGQILSRRTKKTWFVNFNYEKEYNFIVYHTSYLDKNVLFSERVYNIMHDIFDVKKCLRQECVCKIKFLGYSKGYGKYCSKKCSANDIKQKEKRKKTNLEKYGHEYPIQSIKIKNKIKNNNLKKYGVENPTKLKYVQDKMKKTCLERHGVENASQSKKIQDKKKKTCLKKYGVENPAQNKQVKKKYKETCLKRYGVKHFSSSQDYKYKYKQTLLEKYGVKNSFQIPAVIDKIKNRRNISHHNVSKESLEKLRDYNWMYHKHHLEKKSLVDMADILNISYSTISNYLTKHNIAIVTRPSSRGEKEIIKFLNISNIEMNTRKIISPYELDIYLPDYKLAIEFNGLYWHSKHNKNYHLMKTEMCEKKGVHLLHIFENEWTNPIKQEIWKSIISYKLGRNKRIYGRKTEIREISDNKIIKEFLNNNHLQGYCHSNIKLGLFYENELVCIMTFGKTRFSKKYQYELIRFCNKRFVSVIGGASKLYKYFITNYNIKSVVSYADRRYSNGNLYKQLGMTFSHYSSPNYWYFKLPNTQLYSRIKFQKHKLFDLLENFDSNKSEIENMSDNNYLRIFDCGNKIYGVNTRNKERK